MPTRDDIEAGTPRCPHRIVPRPGGWHPSCHRHLRSDSEHELWRCPIHGAVLPWAEAGRRVHRISGRVWFEEEAA